MFHVEPHEQHIALAEKDLLRYRDILLRWQKSVNLISNATTSNVWQRHFLDSARVFDFIPETAKTLADFGSGAGFPGMVLAVLNKHKRLLNTIHLLESDTKKCLFLQEIKRELKLDFVVILNQRIEKTKLPDVDVVTARAVGKIQQLLDWGKGIISPKTTCLFLKGVSVDEELGALKNTARVEKIKMGTDGYLIKLEGVIYE